MDCWIVALRGGEDALVEARAVLGSPAAWLGAVQLFASETADPATAAVSIARLASSLVGVAGGVALEDGDGDGARERAFALACAAEPGEILFDRASRARLARELVFVRPRVRAGWRLAVPAVALANALPLRADCRDAVALLHVPPLVGHEREIAAVIAASASVEPLVVRAPTGWGGGRIIAEAAARAGKTVERVPASAMADAEGLWKALGATRPSDWLVFDPVNAQRAPLLKRVIRQLPTRRLVLRAELDVQLPYVRADREIDVAPLREAEVRAMIRAMLGPATREVVVRRLARRAGYVPRRIVETVRAAVQLGEIVRAGDAWEPRARRAFGTLGAHVDPVGARVAELPPLLFRALRVAASVGDGARAVETLAAMRGTLSHEPDQPLALLEALRLIEREGDQIAVPASVGAFLPAEDDRVLALARAGALGPAAEAEALTRSGRRRDAAVPFARAATAALAAGLRAAAARYAAAASPPREAANGARSHEDTATTELLPDEVLAALRAVTAALSPAVVVEAAAPAGAARRALDPIALEQAAASFAERNDDDGAARMRALAELMRGNSQRALRITGANGTEASSKAQLVAALAQGAAGEVHNAIRTALGALALARVAADRGGEVAALALLSTLYRATGRDDDARLLADGARRLQPA